MTYDYVSSLSRISSARNKRGRNAATTRLFETVTEIQKELPAFKLLTFNDDNVAQRQALLQDDLISITLLETYGPFHVAREWIPKQVKGDGNCLFNSASVGLIGT